jgi:hypothetical protein
MQLLWYADLCLLLLLRLRGACAGPRPSHVMCRHGPCSPARRLTLPLQRIGACKGGKTKGRGRAGFETAEWCVAAVCQ